MVTVYAVPSPVQHPLPASTTNDDGADGRAKAGIGEDRPRVSGVKAFPTTARAAPGLQAMERQIPESIHCKAGTFRESGRSHRK